MHPSLSSPDSGFITAVYWQPGDIDIPTVRAELLRMKASGLDAVRYHNANAVETAPGVFDFTCMDAWFEAARQAEMPVLLHTNLVQPSRALLDALDIEPERFDHLEADDPDFLRAVEAQMRPVVEHLKDHPFLMGWGLNGEPNPVPLALHPEWDRQPFARWLERQYGTVEELNRVWMPYPDPGHPLIESFDTAIDLYRPATEALFDGNPATEKRYYAAMRDRMRFHAERMTARAHACARLIRSIDDSRPTLNGSHNFMYNQPVQGWDIEGWANTADVHFSSIHLPWHFEPVHGEVDLPLYLHSRMTRDFNKGGFNSPYETTGGAVMYSGGYGNHMSPGLMRRMMFSYLAAENDAIGFWVWNHRVASWEVGEYGLTSMTGALTPWCEEMTLIAAAFKRWKSELRQASARPKVALLYSWNTEAILTLEPERFEDQEGPTPMSRGNQIQHQRALVGAARVLSEANLPFEYVTESEVQSGGLPYDLILLPHCRALAGETLTALNRFVQQGGQVVGDVQTAFTDPWGKLPDMGPGGALDRLFGAWFDTVHDARTTETLRWNGQMVSGFFGDLTPGEAEVRSRFSDGRPALTRHPLGSGAAWLLATDPFRACADPGQVPLQHWLSGFLQTRVRPGFHSSLPLTFRLQGEDADHWFILNPGDIHPLTLRVDDRTPGVWTDVLADKAVGAGTSLTIDIPAESALWLRAERQSP
jgi:beta-galactosidase